MLIYEQYYRKFGLRLPGHLSTPPIFKMELLDLPRDSIYHFLGSITGNPYPDPEEFILRYIKRIIPIEHVTDVSFNEGSPRPVTTPLEPLIKSFQAKNRRYRRVTDFVSGLKDPFAPLVLNYAFLWNRYKYMRSFNAEWFKWRNVANTAWDHISKTMASNNRQHFYEVGLPRILPSVGDLRKAEMGLNQSLFQIFNSHEAFMLFEIWKWLGPNRDNSIITRAGGIDGSNYKRINLLFIDAGVVMLINLGILDGWRNGGVVEGKPQTTGFDPKDLQLRFMRLIMKFIQVRADGIPPDQEVLDDMTDVGNPKLTFQDEAPPEVTVGATAVTVIKPTIVSKAVLKKTENREKELAQVTIASLKADVNDHALLQKELEGLDQVRKLATTTGGLADEDGVIDVTSKGFDSPEDGIRRVCKTLSEEGMMNGGEIKKYEALAQTYKTIKVPGTNETLETFVKVDPAKLIIKKDEPMRTTSRLVDKSMAFTTLNDLDAGYVKNIMQRDIAAAVLSVQNAGICLTGYETERVESVLGAYDSITLRLNPIEGQPSTIRMRIPVVDDEGVYKTNGIRYRIKRQRGDLPIRKISPSRVALTSQYGKTFVSRSEKKVNSYYDWICNAVMAAGLDAENKAVSNIKPGNVFDPEFTCPRLYSGLATNFESFHLNDFEVMLNHRVRETFFGKDKLALYEKNGSLLIGKNTYGFYLLMDKDENLFICSKGKMEPVSGLEAILKLDPLKAPVEFAELKVLGKQIPIGVILAYELGLDNLISLLKATHRRVPAGTRARLTDREYAIVFSDETLVFSRDEPLASMVLAGFHEVRKGIRDFSVYDFDRKDVYLPALESIGASSRHLKEIDLIYQMFIDPVTKEMLIEMGEPTEIGALLRRASELLINDQHKAEMDARFMRDKGYERFSAAIYSEMVKTVRQHSLRPGKSRQQLEMNPYAVWKTITQDPAVMLVNEINPVQNLKEQEAITYNGVGGRSSRSMTRHTRVYNKSDVGVISESTVDSGDVGINVFTSANPQYKSLRDTIAEVKPEDITPSMLLSTSALLSPGSTHDDQFVLTVRLASND